MGNHIKFCGCKSCRRGMHSGAYGSAMVKKIIRKFRRITKAMLRKGEELDTKISVPYTD